MSKATAAAIFFLIWWVVLFAVLPWGVHSQHEGGDMAPGTDPGAPAIPKLGLKLLWTTVMTCVIYAACYVAYASHLLSIDRLTAPFDFHN
jgi:predicted secreted protein